MTVTFFADFSQTHIDLELDSICGKPMKRRFQQYIVRAEILSTFQARVEYISVRKMRHSAHSNQWDKNAPSLGAPGPPSNTSISRPTYTQRLKRHPDPLSHFATIYFPDRQTDRPTDRHNVRQMG